VSLSCVSFACPLFLRRRHESLIEVCAGKLEGEGAESRISKEAEEETGFLVRNRRRVVEAYMNLEALLKSSLSSRQGRRTRRRRRRY
jgi:8-oxo-dGTP pyrophosphatase MutT (NUDIX family)